MGEMVRLSMTHGIGLYSAHTNFDQVHDGTADVLAQLLDLECPEPVVPTQDGMGYGRVGILNPALNLKSLLELIQQKAVAPPLDLFPCR